MSGGARIPLDRAERLAAEVVDLLRPACERLQVAGSLRRQRPTVGDIEIVAIPRREPGPPDLFGTPGPAVDALHARCLALLRAGTFAPRLNALGRQAIGEQLKWLTFQQVGLDVYSATPETWGVTLAIRTGPAEWSHRLVTARRQGGLCPDYLRFRGWRVVHRDGEVLSTPEERDVFDVLGLAWLEPEDRA